MTITALPTPPSRSDDPAGFSAKADTFLAALPTFVTEANALQSDVNTKQTTASDAATTATTKAGEASTSANNAAASATTASQWATKTDGVVSGGEYSAKYYANLAAGVVATIPSGTINDAAASTTSVYSSTKTEADFLKKSGGVASGLTLNGGYTEGVYALTGTDINPANGSIQTKTLYANTTFTESIADGQSVILGITAGSYTVTWPSVTWAKVGGSGVAPTLTSTGVNWVILFQVGGILRGAFLGTA